jgi:protoporphyrinogen oxidase
MWRAGLTQKDSFVLAAHWGVETAVTFLENWGNENMEIGIVGAGITGLTAAYELGKAGHNVTLFEQAAQAGGLSGTFRDERWDWRLEKFYHHLFASDDIVLSFSREIGLGDKIFFPKPVTAIWHDGDMNAFDSPLAVLGYPYLSFLDKMRVGLVTLYLRLSKSWGPLERVTAHEWLPRYIGRRAYEGLWEPLLSNKFGDSYQEVNMAWFWARIHKRTQRLGYYVGGYQTLIDTLVSSVQDQGGVIRLKAPVARIEGRGPRIGVHGEESSLEFDVVLVTVSPRAMLRLAPDLPQEYLAQVRGLRSVGALTLILALDRPVTDGFYWVNLPKGQFPFIAFVEHTNYQPPEHYGGDHLVYLGDYPAPEHRYFRMSKNEILQEFLPSMTKFNPAFDASWVRRSWLFREEYAQPVVPVNYSKQIPPIRTPVPGLYFASMSHVYPWDRGSNYAVEMGQNLANMVLEDGVGEAELQQGKV